MGSSNETSAGTRPQDKELIQEQESESQVERLRQWRQDIVLRYWGSETELTKAAYEYVNGKNPVIDPPVTIAGKEYDNIKKIKDRILTLKLIDGRSDAQENELQELLGALTRQIAFIKEMFVMQKMSETQQLAYKEIK